MKNLLKVLTLGFFISMITGFVVYRMGYFDPESSANALQTSPNGSELINENGNANASQTQDTTNPAANQAPTQPIMPLSKSMSPAFDLKKYEAEQKKQQMMSSSKSIVIAPDFRFEDSASELKNPYMHSSKSLIHPINIGLMIQSFQFEANRQAIKVQPKLVKKDSTENEAARAIKIVFPVKKPNIVKGEDAAKQKSADKPKGISWGMIGLGVLGILFVGAGSIAYFKKRSK